MKIFSKVGSEIHPGVLSSQMADKSFFQKHYYFIKLPSIFIIFGLCSSYFLKIKKKKLFFHSCQSLLL